MQHRRLTVAAAIVAANLVAIAPALATSMSNLPPEETEGAVTFRMGGIGSIEATAMRQAESRYPLSLEFAERAKPKDEFLANVEVTIKDHDGKTMLRTFSDGPFLLASLPDGNYTVTAVREGGQAQTRQVTVASGTPEHLVFEW